MQSVCAMMRGLFGDLDGSPVARMPREERTPLRDVVADRRVRTSTPEERAERIARETEAERRGWYPRFGVAVPTTPDERKAADAAVYAEMHRRSLLVIQGWSWATGVGVPPRGAT